MRLLETFRASETYIQHVADFEKESQEKYSSGLITLKEMKKINSKFTSDENTVLLIKSFDNEIAKKEILKSNEQEKNGASAYYAIIASGALMSMFGTCAFMMDAEDLTDADKIERL